MVSGYTDNINVDYLTRGSEWTLVVGISGTRDSLQLGDCLDGRNPNWPRVGSVYEDAAFVKQHTITAMDPKTEETVEEVASLHQAAHALAVGGQVPLDELTAEYGVSANLDAGGGFKSGVGGAVFFGGMIFIGVVGLFSWLCCYRIGGGLFLVSLVVGPPTEQTADSRVGPHRIVAGPRCPRFVQPSRHAMYNESRTVYVEVIKPVHLLG